MTTITHRFHASPAEARALRSTSERPRFRERLRLREAAGYLADDRAVVVEAPPATILAGLEVAASGAVTARVELLATEEGIIIRHLAGRLDADQYRWRLVRDSYGDVLGIDFELTHLATRRDVERALRRPLGADEAREIAAALVSMADKPRPIMLPPPARKRQPAPMDALVQRVRETEREQAAQAERSRPLGYAFDA